MSVCLSVYLSVGQAVYMMTFLSVLLPVPLFNCPTVWLCMLDWLSLFLFVCLPAHLSFCWSVCLSVCLSLFICLSMLDCWSLFVFISFCLSVCWSFWLGANLSLCSSVCLLVNLSISVSMHNCSPLSLFVCLTVCLSVCLSLHQYMYACIAYLEVCLTAVPCVSEHHMLARYSCLRHQYQLLVHIFVYIMLI